MQGLQTAFYEHGRQKEYYRMLEGAAYVSMVGRRVGAR
jgi:hypothetical protein